MTFTWSKRPGKKLIHGARPLNKFSDNRLRTRISPIKINNGKANIVALLALFQSIFDNIVNGGLSVKKTTPNNPTTNNEIPTHTVLPKNSTSNPNIVKDTAAKLKMFPPLCCSTYRPKASVSGSSTGYSPVFTCITDFNISEINCKQIKNDPKGIAN